MWQVNATLANGVPGRAHEEQRIIFEGIYADTFLVREVVYVSSTAVQTLGARLTRP